MSCLAISGNYLVVSKGLHIDCFNSGKHDIMSIPISSKPQENDTISDLVLSSDCKYLAAVSSVSKQLTVFELPLADNLKSFILPRSTSKIRFTTNNNQILVADKTGDVLLYDTIENTNENGTKLLGHLSLLLDILQTDDGKHIITSDRDEKVKVSCYPNTYNIQTYCLGHKEFVNHIEILPHDKNYLTSTSGDGTIKFWNYLDGQLIYNIDTNTDIEDSQLKEDFIKIMNDDGIDVSALPIIHSTMYQQNESSSLLVVAIHMSTDLLVYRIHTENEKLSHKLIERLNVDRFPAAIKLHNLSLYVYDDVQNTVKVFKIHCEGGVFSITSDNVMKMFEGVQNNENKVKCETIKVMYKRKFDNVQEYQERKKQRLEKATL